MSNANVSGNDRLSPHRFRAPLALVGAALLSLSLLLSVGPALGAANRGNGNSSNSGGNGTSGNVKVHDAATGVETLGGDNEPHVCDFWLEFTFDAPFEAGTWVLVSWAPTGDGSTIVSGVYDTSGDGIDSSSVIDVPAGHYRVEWAATGATASKKKTFWVDAGCDEPASPVEESPVATPAEESAAPAEESQAEEPAPSAEESVLPAEESQAGEPAPSAEQSVLPAEESQVEEPAPSAEASVVEDPAQAEDPGSTDPGAPPAQDQLDSAAGSGEPTMSDTAMPTLPVTSGLLATIGILLLIVVHATARREIGRDYHA